MQGGQTEGQFSSDEIAGFTEKVEEWGAQLTERERQLLATVLRSPSPTDDEVAGYAGLDGISYLIAVTQMKASNANDAALSGAESQRTLISQKSAVRAAQRKLEDWKP